MNGTKKSRRQRFIHQTEAGVTANLGFSSGEVAAERDRLIAALWRDADVQAAAQEEGFALSGRYHIAAASLLLVLAVACLGQLGTCRADGASALAAQSSRGSAAAPRTAPAAARPTAPAAAPGGDEGREVGLHLIKNPAWPIETIEGLIRKLWRAFPYGTTLILLLAAIKLWMGESVGQVIGCGFRTVAFLIDDAVSVARFVSGSLRTMATKLSRR